MPKIATGFIALTLLAPAPACGPKQPDPILPPPEQTAHRGTYDPTSGCQQALGHVIDLTIQATGAGPSDSKRGEVVQRCVKANSARANGCVMELRRLPGRRGGKVNLSPVWRCFSRR